MHPQVMKVRRTTCLNKLPAISADSVFAWKTKKEEKNKRRLLVRCDNRRGNQR